jgi:sigma-E factor negative regulatory protein RseC
VIEEQAVVIAINGDQLTLEAKTQSSCGACNARAGCGTSLLSSVVGQKFTHFQAENTVNADIGDVVMVGIPEKSLLTGSLVVYMLPIILMIGFALVGERLLDMDDIDPGLVSGIAGFAVGVLLAQQYFRRAATIGKYTPVILRKLIDHGKLSR